MNIAGKTVKKQAAKENLAQKGISEKDLEGRIAEIRSGLKASTWRDLETKGKFTIQLHALCKHYPVTTKMNDREEAGCQFIEGGSNAQILFQAVEKHTCFNAKVGEKTPF